MNRCLIVLVLFAFINPVRADDSLQFRGTGSLGISKETGLPVHWGEKENVRWKANLPGRGLSSPVIAGNRVFVTASSRPDQDRLHVLCFDAESGKELWHRQLWATGATLCHTKTCMAAPTPVTDGQRVMALFATADLVCYDRDGNLLWYRSLTGDYPTLANNVGMAASPVLWNDLLLLCLENVGASFAAGIDKHTGQNRWKIDRPRAINWASPLVIQYEGEDQFVFQGSDGLAAHDPATGKKLWSLTNGLSNIPSPTFADNLILAPGSRLVAVRPGTSKKEPKLVWQAAKLPTGYASPLCYKGLVYALTPGGILNCADGASGKSVGSRRLEGSYAASPLAADGKIYLVSEEGTTTIVEAGPEMRVLATNSLPDKFLATPVAAAGALFLRSDQHLYCIAVAAPRNN